MNAEPRLISLKDASRLLGGLSTKTLRSYIADPVDPLPAIRLKGRILIDVGELRTFLDRHRIRPANIDEIVTDLAKTISGERDRVTGDGMRVGN